MTQEDKKLLLTDICARLPYNVVIRCTDNDTDYKCFLTTDILNELLHNIEYYDYKPYLRPMSSMTAEEQAEFVQFHCVTLCPVVINDCLTIGNESKMIDWLLAHHFDFRGLIPMGLALEVPEGMYKIK